MKVQRARTGAGRGVVRACASSELAGGRIETVDVNHVAAQVVDVGEAIVRREGAEVRVRGFLPVGVGPVHGVVLRPDRGLSLPSVTRKLAALPPP